MPRASGAGALGGEGLASSAQWHGNHAREAPTCSRHDHAPNRLRVAVCIVGFARTFGSRAVHRSIANTFRDGPEAAFDFFAVISLGDKEQDTAKGQRYPVGADAVEPARKVLRPTGWDQASLRPEGPRACKDPCMSQFERLEQCGALVAAEELRCGRTYSWVAKVRTDTVVSGSIASWAQLNQSFLWKDRWAGDSLVLLPRGQFDAIVRDLGSGNIREYAPFNSSRSRASQPESCWGMCSPTSMCRCARLLYYVGQKAGLTPRYHSLHTVVQRTLEATAAYNLAARFAALSGRLRNASRPDRYSIKMLHNHSWDDLAATNRSVQRYEIDGVLRRY